MAVHFLEDAGYTVIFQNFRFSRAGEIDIIAQKDGNCVFVEVKLRHFPLYTAEKSINRKKIDHLKRAALGFITIYPEKAPGEVRFDLINIVDGAIEWYRDIFR